MKHFYLMFLLWGASLLTYGQQDTTSFPNYVTPEEIELYHQRGIVAPTDRGITSPPVYPNKRTAAEWEEIEALTIAWRSYPSILKQIVAAAKEEAEVIILSENPNTTANYLTSNNAGGPPMDLNNVSIVSADLNSVWIRDYMAHTVYGNEVDDRYMVDWIYNRPRPFDDVIPDVVGNYLDIDVYSTTTPPNDLMACGGNFMSDGFGRGFSSSLILDENQGGTTSWGAPYPNHTVAEINGIYQDYMGVDPFIIMQKLPYDGIHHIDMHMKLLDEETILVSKYPEGVADGPQIATNLEMVQNNYTTKWGTPFKIVEVPAPPDPAVSPQNGPYPDGNGRYLTYTNSVFVNKTVIVPIYYEQYDTTALRIYEEQLPGYNIVGINCMGMIGALGAIHCITHSVGVDDPLLISYQPLPDTDNNAEPYPLTAYINHKSGISGATLYWKTDLNDPYTAVSMTSIGNNEWTADIPAQPFGSKVYYYVEGVANSGKVQVRPIVAPEGYRMFRVINEVFGCTDPNACNYNPEATIDDGSCSATSGCTNPEACNYNPNADCDDGSCQFGTSWYVDADGDGFGDMNDENPLCENPCDDNYVITISGTGWLDEVTWTFSDSGGTVILQGGPYGNTSNGGSFSASVNSSNGPFSFFIETQGQFDDNTPNYLIETGTGITLASGTRPGGTTFTLNNVFCAYADNNTDCDDSDPNVNPGMSEISCNGIDDNCSGTIDDEDIFGCTDPTAENYNPLATCDDGSCPEPCFEPVVRALSPPEAAGLFTYTTATSSGWGGTVGEPSVTGQAVWVDDGSGSPTLGCGALVNSSELNGNIAVALRGSCQFSAKALNAQNAGATALIVINNSGGGPAAMGAGDFADQINIPVVMISQADGNTLTPYINAGTLQMFIGNDCEPEVPGCADPSACNYNPDATSDDGTCEYTSCLDCNNVPNGTAFIDNCGQCVGGTTGEEACTADCNGDFGGTAFIDNCDNCVGGNTGNEPCVADCNGDFGGTAFIDNCDNCVGGTTGDEPCVADCNGDFGGTAFLDNCGVCVGGATGLQPCAQDCNGVFGGTAFIDNCGECVGGTTGEEACTADCNGDFGGSAFIDNCDNCVGGTTGDEPCVADCNGDFGGTAFLDNCGVCVGGATGLQPCAQDCNGVFGGTAFIDNCGECVGGTTGEEACTADCNGDFGGTAFIDNCDNCVGGNTGNEPCDPQTDCELSYSYTTVPATLGFANGAATIMVTGGQEPYSYQWNDAFMQTEPELLGVFAGTYMCVVQDAAGCEEAFSVDVPFADNVPTTQVHPNFCNTGGYELGDFISATSIPSAQAYRWEFTPVGGAPLPEYTRSTNNPWIRIAWIDGVALAQTYQVRVKVLVNGVWGEYGNICTISTSNTIPLTELRPEYHGSNGGGEPYALCDIMIAYSVSGATNYRWRIDPDNDPNNGNEIYYVRGSSNPGARLSWIGGLQPGQQYHVAVEAAVGDVWAGFGAVHSISLGSPAITAVRPNFCGVTFASVSGLLIAQSVCSADYYEWEFVNTTTGITSTAQRPNTGISLNWNGISPPLEPGEIEIRVRVQQEGVLGDFGPVCNIAIEGPGMPVPDVASLKSAIQENTVIYPNPSSGNEVRLELSGLDEGNHHVAIHVYDVHGKLLLNDGFGHTGSVVSRLIRFNQSLSKGMYMVHVVVDGERFVTEKLVVH